MATTVDALLTGDTLWEAGFPTDLTGFYDGITASRNNLTDTVITELEERTDGEGRFTTDFSWIDYTITTDTRIDDFTETMHALLSCSALWKTGFTADLTGIDIAITAERNFFADTGVAELTGWAGGKCRFTADFTGIDVTVTTDAGVNHLAATVDALLTSDALWEGGFSTDFSWIDGAITADRNGITSTVVTELS